jgi:ribonuclease III
VTTTATSQPSESGGSVEPAGGSAEPAVDDHLARLTDRLGVPLSPALLRRALTHRSYAFENGGLPSNERLEFLGDAVLGLAVTDALYRRYPDRSEGQLAKNRSGVVSAVALAEVAAELDLGSALLLGRGEELTGGRGKASIVADALEAVIGAVYLEHGFTVAAATVLRLVGPRLDSAAAQRAGTDWKTDLQELAAAAGLPVPVYRVTGSGPDHARRYAAEVLVEDRVVGRGTGASKKQAEQNAAEQACREMRALRPDG